MSDVMKIQNIEHHLCDAPLMHARDWDRLTTALAGLGASARPRSSETSGFLR